jgi:LPS sulfotransferase NodH
MTTQYLAPVVTSSIPEEVRSLYSMARQQLGHMKILSQSEKVNSYSPLFILSTPRSGSSYLNNLLSNPAEVCLYDELLNPHMGHYIGKTLKRGLCARWIDYQLKRLIDPTSRDARYRGAKLHLCQLERARINADNLVTYFAGAQCILLYRRNLVDQYLSLCIAKLSNSWRAPASQTWHPPQIYFDSMHFVSYAQNLRRMYNDWSSNLPKDSRIIVAYEDILGAAAAKSFGEISEFLGLANPLVVSGAFEEHNRWGHSIIANQKELQDVMISAEAILEL